MSRHRLASLPIDHLEAEFAAFPLASEAAFSLGVTTLRRDLGGATKALWRAAERHFVGQFPSFSLTELGHLRDKIWFGAADGRESTIGAYLANLAGTRLQAHGMVARPKPLSADEAHCEAPGPRGRMRWRWLAFALPDDWLLAALPGAARAGRIDLLSPHLVRMLAEEGYAEIHCHLGGAVRFPDLWVGLTRAFADSGFGAKSLRSEGAAFENGEHMAPWLLRGCLARLLLARFLARRDSATDFDAFLDDWARRWPATHSLPLHPLFGALADLRQPRRGPRGGYAALQVLYTHLSGLARLPLRDAASQHGDLIQHGDPIARFFPPLGAVTPEHRLMAVGLARLPLRDAASQHGDLIQHGDPIARFFPPLRTVTPEHRLMAVGLAYLAENPQDRSFALLFWQMARLRGLFYRHVTQRPMTPGLEWFIRFYQRMRTVTKRLKIRQSNDLVMIPSALALNGAKCGLRSLEMRIAPDESISKMHRRVKDALDIADKQNPVAPVELGFVVHFQKERSDTKHAKPGAMGRGSHADPSPRANSFGFRYGRYYGARRREALALARLLLHKPGHLAMVRGLDVCTDEMAIPNWVLAPLFRYVSEAAMLASSVSGLPALRRTLHVGEDFPHLMGGLRRIDEVVHRLPLAEGDRIGHGLALGIDPEDWAARGGMVAMPAEERLFDLAWEWEMYARGACTPPDAVRILRVQREIERLTNAVFGAVTTPSCIVQLMDHLYSERALQRVGFPGLNRERSASLLERYLTSGEIFRRGQALQQVDATQDLPALHVLRAAVKRSLAQRSIVIETNPTSNLLIAHAADLDRHPLWRLSTPDEPLDLAIGSDDPLTFATSLPEEYQVVADSLMLRGQAHEEALAWVHRARKTGLKARFTQWPRTGPPCRPVIGRAPKPPP